MDDEPATPPLDLEDTTPPPEPVDPDRFLDVLAERPMDLEELCHHLEAEEAAVIATLEPLLVSRAVLDWGGVYAVAWRTLYTREPRRSLAYLGIAIATGVVVVLGMTLGRGA